MLAAHAADFVRGPRDNGFVGEIKSDTRVHVVRAVAWKDAVIKLLEPDSPYLPWDGGPSAEPGDGVIVVLDTEPAAVIAELLVVGEDGRADRALDSCMNTEDKGRPALLELATLTALTGVSLQYDESGLTVQQGDLLVEMMGERIEADVVVPYLQGHSTLAQARILLNSGGWCTGCRRELDLAGAQARYHVHVHTVDFSPPGPRIPVSAARPEEPDPDSYGPDSIRLGNWWEQVRIPLDWPAVLCDDCHDHMRTGGFTGFLDYRFSLHPRCPECSARWTVSTFAGFPSRPPSSDPWTRHTGCTPGEKWQCAACGHGFGGKHQPFEPED